MRGLGMRVVFVVLFLFLSLGIGCEDEAKEGMIPGECSDDADNDGDGAFDCDDSDCFGAPHCADSMGDTGIGSMDPNPSAPDMTYHRREAGTDAWTSDLHVRDDSRSDVNSIPDACGNGTVDPGEACDGENFGNADCVTEGFASGRLTCTEMCRLDTTTCSTEVQRVFSDPETNLTWQGCLAGQSGPDCTLGSFQEMNHAAALSHCEGLSWGTYDDWRLPNIDELRTLMRDCPSTETGGSCPVTHACSYSTGAQDTCGENFCQGCQPAMHLPFELEASWGGGRWLHHWSVSLAVNTENAYQISYWHADIGVDGTLRPNVVRCVR